MIIIFSEDVDETKGVLITFDGWEKKFGKKLDARRIAEPFN